MNDADIARLKRTFKNMTTAQRIQWEREKQRRKDEDRARKQAQKQAEQEKQDDLRRKFTPESAPAKQLSLF